MAYFILFVLKIYLLFLTSKKVSSGTYRIIYKITKSKNISYWLFSVLFIPGTLLHELSHFIVAKLTGVPAGHIDLIPKVEKGSIRMGRVSIGKTDPVRRYMVGIAPPIIGISFILLLISRFLENDMFGYNIATLILIYLLFVMGNSMFSSKKDMEGSYKFYLLVIGIYVGLRYLGINIAFTDFFFKWPTVFEKATVLMLFPLAVNSFIITVIKLARP